MSDFFDQVISTNLNNHATKHVIKTIYNIDVTLANDVFVGANLQWPKFDLPAESSRYFISFHTEYMDLHWLIKQAQQVYPKPILLVTDWVFYDQSIIPDNVTIVQYITIDKQLKIAIDKFGIQLPNKSIPQYKISSLSFRVTQYKNFVTAYLLQNFPKSEMILSYHNYTGKPQDHHSFPDHAHLSSLSIDQLTKTFVNFNDDFSLKKNSPVANANWRMAPYTECMINLTNESFHYSNTMMFGQSFRNPGPYLTEKTFKPLLAGMPFLAVGQADTYRYLDTLGFDTNFGFNTHDDNDPGDLTRVNGIFQTINKIRNLSIPKLLDQSFDAVAHNLRYLQCKEFGVKVSALNTRASQAIRDFL